MQGDYLTWNDRDDWPLNWFRPSELACKGAGGLRVHRASAIMLDRVRTIFAAPLVCTSGYRSVGYNQTVGGAPNSYHTRGQAFDVKWPGGAMDHRLLKAIHAVGFTGLGFYPDFVHIDTGPPRVWVGGVDC